MAELFIIFFAVFVMILAIVRYKRKSGKKAEYDERQLLIRGNAYKYGFFTAIGINAICMLCLAQNDNLLQYALLFLTLPFFAGVLVFTAYSILHDAFYSVKNKCENSYLILVIACIAAQCAALFADGGWRNPALIFGSIRIINLCCGITFLVILILLIWKRAADRREEGED